MVQGWDVVKLGGPHSLFFQKTLSDETLGQKERNIGRRGGVDAANGIGREKGGMW